MSVFASQGKDIMGGTRSSLATITGIGCGSPFGVGGRDVVADVIKTSATAIGPITNFSTDGLSRHVGAEIPPEHLPRTDAVRRELEAYFAGKLRDFSTRVDWSLVRGFAVDVLRATASVPFGQLTTYRDVAGAAGSPRAARAAGNALGSNPIPIVVPCHRVIGSDGSLTGFGGGLHRLRV